MRFSKILASLSVLLVSSTSFAFNLDWSGLYRIEGVQVENSEFDGVEREKSYIHHHLILKPRAVVADGLIVYSRFDIFNNAQMANTQFGQFFGSGSGTSANNPVDNSNTASQAQADESLLVTNLYLTYEFEFASLIAGRAPLHFGAGLVHNAGNGLYDHYYDNRDLLAFEIISGNLKFRPMFAKVNEGDTDIGDDVNDYMLSIDYDNAETDTGFGIFFQARRGTLAGNDSNFGNGTATDGFDQENINVFFKRGWKTFDFNFEAGFASGDLGVTDGSGNKVKMEGMGLALDMNYRPEGSRYSYNLMAGMAQGDDPATTDKFEGFFFDRNYNVGLLLFNHVMGQFDALATSQSRNTTSNINGGQAFTNAGAFADVETVSNAVYLSPAVNYQYSDKWSFGGRFVYAFLNEDDVSINGTTTRIDTDLGMEIDLSATFKPHDRFQWTNEVGVLMPGKAFEGGSNGFATKTAYALMTKAAISF